MKLLLSFVFTILFFIVFSFIHFSDFSFSLNNDYNLSLPSEYDHLSIELFLIKEDIERQKRLEIKKIFDLEQKLSLDELSSKVNSASLSFLFKDFYKKYKTIVSYQNRIYLNKIAKKLIKREIKEFPKMRNDFAKKLNHLYSDKYIKVSVLGKHNEILYLDWFYFASKDKRHEYLDKLKISLSKFHFKKIIFDNSIDRKKTSYLIQSLNDNQFGF